MLPWTSFFVIVVFCNSPLHGFELISLRPVPGLQKEHITVSGMGSGGTMAQQMFVAHSSLFQGCATVAHAFYRCGPGDGIAANYDDVCTRIGNNSDPGNEYSPDHAVKDIYRYHAEGLIDDPTVHLRGKRLFVVVGTANPSFSLNVQHGPVRVFSPFIQTPSAIRVKGIPAGLTLPADNPDLPPCSSKDPPSHVSNCGFSAVLEAMKWMVPQKWFNGPSLKGAHLGQLVAFDQTEFFSDIEDHVSKGGPGMDALGYIYVPSKCLKGAHCLLHVYFHGCNAGRESVGKDHILASGWLELAEENGIVVLFPQATGDCKAGIKCWDAYGFASQHDVYATKYGVQIVIVKNMIERLLGLDEDDESKEVGQTYATSCEGSESGGGGGAFGGNFNFFKK